MEFRQWLEAQGRKKKGFGYHITPQENIPSIIKKGLIPGYNPNWDDYFALHSGEGVFFTTSPEEVQYWMTQYDNPVVLKFNYDVDELIGLDSHAQSEGFKPNYILPRAVPAKDIEIWTGSRKAGWVPVKKFKNFIDDYANQFKWGRQKTAPDPRTLGILGTGGLYSYKGKSFSGDIKDYFPDYVKQIQKYDPEFEVFD